MSAYSLLRQMSFPSNRFPWYDFQALSSLASFTATSTIKDTTVNRNISNRPCSSLSFLYDSIAVRLTFAHPRVVGTYWQRPDWRTMMSCRRQPFIFVAEWTLLNACVWAVSCTGIVKLETHEVFTVQTTFANWMYRNESWRSDKGNDRACVVHGVWCGISNFPCEWMVCS